MQLRNYKQVYEVNSVRDEFCEDQVRRLSVIRADGNFYSRKSNRNAFHFQLPIDNTSLTENNKSVIKYLPLRDRQHVLGVLVLQRRRFRRALELLRFRFRRELRISQARGTNGRPVPAGERGETEENSEHAVQESDTGKPIPLSQRSRPPKELRRAKAKNDLEIKEGKRRNDSRSNH